LSYAPKGVVQGIVGRCALAAQTLKSRLVEEGGSAAAASAHLQGKCPLRATARHRATERWTSLGD